MESAQIHFEVRSVAHSSAKSSSFCPDSCLHGVGSRRSVSYFTPMVRGWPVPYVASAVAQSHTIASMSSRPGEQ